MTTLCIEISTDIAIILLGGIAVLLVLLFPGISFILFSHTKQQRAYRDCMRTYQAVEASVESVRSGRREPKTTLGQRIAVLYRRVRNNRGMRVHNTAMAMRMLAAERITEETNEQSQLEACIRALKVARKELEMIDDSYTPRGKRMNAYFYVCFAIIGLMLKTLLVTVLFAAIAVSAFVISMLLVSILLQATGCGMLEITGFFDEQMSLQLEETAKTGYIGWGILALVILCTLAIFMVFMQKVTKLLIIFTDIIFDGFKLTTHVVLTERIDMKQVSKDITAISLGVKRKNSSGIFDKFFREMSD